jgi:hypothetical protein
LPVCIKKVVTVEKFGMAQFAVCLCYAGSIVPHRGWSEGGVHDADINPPLDEVLHEFRLETVLGANGYLRPGCAHQLKPLQQEFFPQANSSTDDQRTAETFRNSNRSNERSGVPLKLSTGRRQRCASLAADKERAAKLVFERVNARADRRLADVKPVSGADEAFP